MCTSVQPLEGDWQSLGTVVAMISMLMHRFLRCALILRRVYTFLP